MKYITYAGIFSFGIMFQMIFNIPNRPWFDDKNIYRGDTVIHSPEGIDKYYTNCKQGKVLAVDNEIFAVRWEQCDTKDSFEGILYDFHNRKNLELKYFK